MDKVPVSKLRSNLMKILKRIKHGEEIDITSRGQIVAKLVPPDSIKEKAEKKLKELAKTAYIGDIISPVESEWKANQ